MSLLDSYRALARYNAWMNRRLYAHCRDELTDEERQRDLKAFFGSVHRTLHHLLLADRIWLGRFAGDPARYASRGPDGEIVPIARNDQVIYTAFEDLAREREKTDADIQDFFAALDEARLAEPFRYRTIRGDTHDPALWWAVTHFFNHQTHHRGQVTTLLMQLGHDPGVTDLVFMLWEERASP